MWLLTSRNRQAMCQRVLDACERTGISTPGIAWCDGCWYPGLRVPAGWCRIETVEHQNIGHALRRFLAAHPDLPWYGWMADDCEPVSPGWDRALVEAAGDWGIAYPDDGWQQGVKQRDGTPHVTSIVCLGGQLVRAMGMLALPDQVQAYIDDVWEAVAVPLGLMRYRPEVKSEHRHWSNGRRPRDGTDTRVFKGEAFLETDRLRFERWRDSGEAGRVRDRVLAAMRAASERQAPSTLLRAEKGATQGSPPPFHGGGDEAA